jgi:hypothetical protein
MRQTKLAETLRSLSARERSSWRQFLWSDYHNRHKALRALCDALLAHAPGFDDSMEKRAIFVSVFGISEPYNELKFNNLVSDLYERLLDWLASERQLENTLELQRQRTLALLERNLNKQAGAALEKYKTLLERNPQRNAQWYRHAAHIEEAAEILHSRQPRRADSPHLLRQAQYTHFVQALEKLRLGVALRSRSSLAVIQGDDHSFLQQDLKFIRNDAALLAALPVARAYLAAYDLLEAPSAVTFEALTSALQAHDALFDQEELTSLYQCALNYCIRCINAGQLEAYADALALYRILLDGGLLLQRGRLSQWTYKNIATTGLRTGAFAWTENFLHQYREALPPEERDNAFAFNIATLYFEKQALDSTLQTLQNVEFTDFTYQIGAKFLQLKTFFLLGEEEALISLLASTEQLLRRDKTLSTFGKATNLNFLKMLRQVVLWQQKSQGLSARESEQKRRALLEKISTLQPLVNRDWLQKALNNTKF